MPSPPPENAPVASNAPAAGSTATLPAKRMPEVMIIAGVVIAIVAGAGFLFARNREPVAAVAAASPAAAPQLNQAAARTAAVTSRTNTLTEALDPVARAIARQGVVKIVLVGDSTVSDGGGWGSGFKQLLTKQAECLNLASGNNSSIGYIQEGRWTAALAERGDYYLIQFGFKDDTDNVDRFFESIKQMVDDTRAIGAIPVLVTPLVRRQWDAHNDHKIKSSLEVFAEEDKRIAAMKNVPLVDLHARSKELCESLGREGCYAFSPAKGTNVYDGTHLIGPGNLMFGRLVAEELRHSVPELSGLLLREPQKTASR